MVKISNFTKLPINLGVTPQIIVSKISKITKKQNFIPIGKPTKKKKKLSILLLLKLSKKLNQQKSNLELILVSLIPYLRFQIFYPTSNLFKSISGEDGWVHSILLLLAHLKISLTKLKTEPTSNTTRLFFNLIII